MPSKFLQFRSESFSGNLSAQVLVLFMLNVLKCVFILILKLLLFYQMVADVLFIDK